MNAATPEQMLAVVKWWARVRGFWWPHAATASEWKISDTFGVLDIWSTRPDSLVRHVSPAVALAWALLVESDAGSVWAGKCKTCDGKKGREVQGLTAFVAQMVDGGWATPQRADGSRDGWMPCSDCERTRETITPVAVLLLDAVERVDAREYLAAHADKLLAAGNPIGELLVWALNLWMVDSDLRHAHTGEAVRWLEWLTWGNWFVERQRLDSLFPEQTFGEAGETYSIQVAGHTYSMRLGASVTAAALAVAFNQQGGPAPFVANDNGLLMDMSETGSASFVTFGHGPAAKLLGFVEPPPEEPRRCRQHAEHIGSRLGRRLGVRR